MARKKRSRKFIRKAVARMEEKGTVGSFGKATPKKIARGKAEGGKQAQKAVFAENMKKIAQRRRLRGSRSRRATRRRSGRR